MRMGDMGPRGAINMGGRDLKQKALVVFLKSFFETVPFTYNYSMLNILTTNLDLVNLDFKKYLSSQIGKVQVNMINVDCRI